MGRTKLSNYVTYLVYILTFFIAIMFDDYFFDIISEHRNFALNIFFIFMTNIGTYVVLLTILLSIMFWLYSKKRLILPLWLSLLLSLIIAYALKYIIQRPRPFTALGVMPVITAGGFSFPSAHAVVIFSLYPVLKVAGNKYSKLFLIIAVLVSFSRLYLGVHYLSDIIAGSLIGYLSGYVIVNYFNKKKMLKKTNG